MNRKFKFFKGEFYHIYNRGVDKRKIFLRGGDYERFIYSLYEFNQEKQVLNFRRRANQPSERGSPSINSIEDSERLVDVVCFCLMPNHFHLLLSQRKDEGISKFLLKISTGYAMYFNKKYNRTGALFEGRFKALHIDNESYLLQLSRYIHLNSLELIEPKWKKEGIKNRKKTKRFLTSYEWSSFPYYAGLKEAVSKESIYPYILSPEMIKAYFKGSKEYKKFVYSWMGEEDRKKIEALLLE